MRLNLGAKLAGSFGVVLLLMGAVALAGYQGVERMRQADEIATTRAEGVKNVLEMEGALRNLYANQADLIINSSDEARAEFQKTRAVVNEWRVKAAAVADTREERDWFQKLETLQAQFADVYDKELLPAWQANDATGMRKADGKSDQILDEQYDIIDGIVTSYEGEVTAAGKEAEDAAAMVKVLMVGVSLLALIVTAFLAYLLSRSIVSGARAMAVAAELLARGNVNQELNVKGHDEIAQTAASFRKVIVYVRSMAETAEAIAQGDLSRKVEARSDEDVLGKAFSHMVANLRQMVGDVSASASELAQASGQLSAASEQAGAATGQIATTIQEVARGNQEQSASVQETSASMEQLSRAIDQIARGSQDQARSIEKAAGSVAQLNASISEVSGASREVSEAGNQAHKEAGSGAEAVNRTVRGMESIRESTSVVAERIAELGSLSEQIGTIVEAIDDIAEQTNLLALNAAIEAARAGEHGRGFAVVAEEVRKLAERAGKSTKEIGALIARTQKGTEEAVAATARGKVEVEEGSRLAQEAGVALSRILTAVAAANGGMEKIAAATGRMQGASTEVVSLMDSVSAVVQESTAAAEEMAASSRQVIGAVERVSAVSEETSASAEEVSASTEEMSAQVEEVVALAQSLSQMADQLHVAVNQFRLETTGVRCWDVKRCGLDVRHKCPAYQTGEDRCWLIPNTWCGGVKQGDAVSKRHNCMNCEAYDAISGHKMASSGMR